MNKKLEEILSTSKLNELIRKSEKQEEKKSKVLWVLAIVGAVAAVAGIAYAVYRFFTPDYLEDFEEDFEDDFDDDFLTMRKAIPRTTNLRAFPRLEKMLLSEHSIRWVKKYRSS